MSHHGIFTLVPTRRTARRVGVFCIIRGLEWLRHGNDPERDATAAGSIWQDTNKRELLTDGGIDSMKENKEAKISYWAAHLTTVVSVTLVLLIVGLIALISCAARSETQRIREQIELSAIMKDSVGDAEAIRLAEYLRRQPYTLTAEVIGKEAAMRNWTEDTGVNLEELYGVNPLSPEVSFTLKSEYATEGNIAEITRDIREIPGVDDVAVPDSSMVSAMNENIERLSYILGGIALAMIIISFVLINNTVHLSIYSRRFTIHTMQLVGATGNFIRRPFILNNMLSGVLAGVIAGVILMAGLAGAPYFGITDISSYIPWGVCGIIIAALLVTGALICALAAYIATTRYLRKDYDDLFK